MRYFTRESLDYTTKLTFLSVVLVVLLYFAGNIIFPFLFALFFAFALLRPVRWLEKIGIPRFISALIITLLGAIILALLITFVVFEGYQLIDKLEISSQTGELESIKLPVNWVEKNLLNGKEIDADNLKMISSKLFSYAGGFFQSIFSKTTSTLIFFGIVPIYVVLLLSYRGNVRMYLEEKLQKRGFEKGKEIIEEITHMVQNYLIGLSFIILIVGVLYGLGLYFIGVKYALFLAIISALLIVIPYIGSILGAVIPISIAWLTTDGWLAPLLVLALYVFVQVLEGYLLTPVIVGKTVKLNPLVVIIGMIILGTIGGIIAMIIAVPILATIKILLKHSERYGAVAILLGNGEQTNV